MHLKKAFEFAKHFHIFHVCVVLIPMLTGGGKGIKCCSPVESDGWVDREVEGDRASDKSRGVAWKAEG